MKHSLLAAVLLSSLRLYAQDAVDVQWDHVCRYAAHRDLLMTTASGDKVEGVCHSITVDELSVRTHDGKIVKVARQALEKMEMQRAYRHQLRSLGKGMRGVLKSGFGALFSPMAPAGLVMVPATLAWGAVSAPFCIVGDIGAAVAGRQRINPI
jgi:hypothetical protein